MITQEIIKKIKKIQIETNFLAEDLLAGMYHSAFKGKGMEFEEVRDYVPGDEIRDIDWNVTARMNHPYVKSFREERELTVNLIVDISASCKYGSGSQLKSDLIAEIGALLAFSAIKNNDKVGLILFSDKIERYVPPKKGLRHVLRIIRELLTFPSHDRQTNLEPVLKYLGNIQKRTAICFLISDFLFPLNKKLLAVTAKHHDLIAIHISDPTEHLFPDMGIITLKDAETGTIAVVDSSKLTEVVDTTKEMIESTGGSYLPMMTNEPMIKPLLKFFKNRGAVR